MADEFVNKIRLEERAANQKHWAGKLKDAIRAGMSHKGNIMSINAAIIKNVSDVIDEMEKQARSYEKENM